MTLELLLEGGSWRSGEGDRTKHCAGTTDCLHRILVSNFLSSNVVKSSQVVVSLHSLRFMLFDLDIHR